MNHRNWVLTSGLLIGVAAAALLFSLKLEVVADSPRQKEIEATVSRQETAPAVGIENDWAGSGVYTVHLPLVGLNLGAPPPLFGVQMYGAVTYTTGLTKVAATGARWIRVPFSWESAEPVNCTPDLYDWTTIDAQVQALTGEGIEPLLTLAHNPSWAAVYPMGPVTDVADLVEFMGVLVERFDGDGYRDAPGSPVVRYWEIYNEPDNTDKGHAQHGGYGYWGYNGEGYAALLDTLYPVVKEASANAQVVFGGVAHDGLTSEGGIFDADFVDDVLANCTGPCFDVMNFHYFPFYRSRWDAYGKDVIGKTNYFREKLASHGFDRPLMCTETTWPQASVWGGDVLQSRYVVAAYVRGMAAELVLQNWYAWRDVDSSLPGLLSNALQPKTAYFVYQTLTAQLGGARYVRPLTEGETGGGNIEGYVFSVPGADGWERLDVVWYDCPEYLEGVPQDCSFGALQTMIVPASALWVTDMYGSLDVHYDVDDGVIDGNVALEVGPDPLYIQYTSPSGAQSLEKRSVLRRHGEDEDENEKPHEPIASCDDEYNYPNCRFGAGVVGDINRYDVDLLNLGWYVDWKSAEVPQSPVGVGYMQMVRLTQVGSDGWALVSPAPEQFTATVQANLGATWLIGNEPDSPYQDDMVPEAYAHAYHDIYYALKGLDPTARVAVGGIVQPTPLRFAYLDEVWEIYRQAYGETMPVDLWNIHTFILRETIGPPDPEPCGPDTIPVWGAYVPPGISAQTGELYCLRDQDSIDIFRQRIVAFRQWMADKGQRNKPLVVTEYGVLFPEDYDDEDDQLFSAERVGTFMQETFDFFRTYTDPSIGYPADGNRLVQQWAWFSVDGAPGDWGGTLFDPDTRSLRTVGQYFRDYTTALTPTVDLLAARAFAEPVAIMYEGSPVTATLKALVSNAGNISTTEPITVTFYDEGGGGPIGEPQVITPSLQGCADSTVVSVAWAGLNVGVHAFSVQVQAGDVDVDMTNNAATGTFLVATHRSFLPLVLRSY